MITDSSVSLSEIARITDTIPGFLLQTEGKLLYEVAKKCPANADIVEIGSWHGRSTVWLYFGSKSGNNAKILAVDPHTGSPELIKQFGKQSSLGSFKSNPKQVGAEKLVTPPVMTSKQAAPKVDKPVGVIFIDGNHSYQSVKQDFDLWFPKLINYGAILLHDTVIYPEINRFVREIVFALPNIKIVKIVDSIVYGQKVSRLSRCDEVKNRYILFLHDLCVSFSCHQPPDKVIVLGKRILGKIH